MNSSAVSLEVATPDGCAATLHRSSFFQNFMQATRYDVCIPAYLQYLMLFGVSEKSSRLATAEIPGFENDLGSWVLKATRCFASTNLQR